MPRRKNGLQFPWSFKLCLSYIAFILYGSTFNIFIISHIPPKYQSEFYVIFNLFLILSLSSHFATTYTDPADPLTLRCKSTQAEYSSSIRCTICESFIQLYSKHCSSCNKCVYKYDHHCFWANNCIGGKNYKVFFAMVLSTTCLAVLITISCIIALVNTFSYYPNRDKDLEIAYLSFIVIMGTFGILAVGYFGYVLVFQIYMMYLGNSTYEYVVKKRSRHLVVPRNFSEIERTESVNIIHLHQPPLCLE